MIRKIKKVFADNWRRQSIIVITFTCLLINAFTITLYVKNEEINENKNWVIHSFEVLRQSRLILTYLQDMEIGQRGYFLSSKPEFLAPYEQARQKIDEEKKLNELLKDNPEQLKDALEIEKDIADHQVVLDEQITKFKSKQRSITIKDLTDSSLFLNSIRIKMTEFQKQERVLLDSRQKEENHKRHSYTRTIIIGSILAIIGLFTANGFVIYQATKRKTVEGELKKSEEIYALVTQGINEGIFDYNIPENKIFYSKGFKQMLGYSDAEFPNTIESVNEHIHPEDFKHTWEIISNFIENKDQAIYRNFFRLRHKDGSYVWIMSRGVGIRNKSGIATRLIGTHTDITEQKENEEYLKRLNTDLENFTYITSHDLRSPLVNLRGFASEMQYSLQELRQLLSVALPKSAAPNKKIGDIVETDLPEALGYIKTSVERLDQLTSAILDLSRIGKRELKLESVDTEEMVKKILATMTYEINNRKVEVKLGELPKLTTDALSLQQVFSNVIENAIKYLDESRPGVISIKGAVFPGETQFIIADNGRGIEEGDKERIFDMFKRARNVKNVRGVGMGMSFVKATIQRLGGKIWFESVVNEGTKFIFTIPNRVRRDVYHE